MIKHCENCSNEFQQKQEHQKYCSTKCRTENHYRKKLGIKQPFNTAFTEQLTDKATEEQNAFKTLKNADIGIFERLLDERESRMTDKIKLAQAEMRIEQLQRELEEAKGFSAIARELAPTLAQLLTLNNQPK